MVDPTRRAIVQRLSKSPAVVSALSARFAMAPASRVRTVSLKPGSGLEGLVGRAAPFHTPVYALTHSAPRRRTPWTAEQRSIFATMPSSGNSPSRPKPPAAGMCVSAAA